jgi:hypothetical protein
MTFFERKVSVYVTDFLPLKLFHVPKARGQMLCKIPSLSMRRFSYILEKYFFLFVLIVAALTTVIFLIVLDRIKPSSEEILIIVFALWSINLFRRHHLRNKMIQNWATDLLDPGWSIYKGLGSIFVHVIRGRYRGKPIRMYCSFRIVPRGVHRLGYADEIRLIMEAPCSVSKVIYNEEELTALSLAIQSAVKHLWRRPFIEEFQLVGSSGLWSLLKGSRPIGFWPVKGFYLRREIFPIDDGFSNLKEDLESLSLINCI